MRNSKAFITSALAIIGILLIGGIALYSRNGSVTMQTGDTSTDTTSTATPTTPEQSTSSSTQDTPGATSPYKDGTYSATGNYVSPGGRQAVSVTVTLKDGIITDATVTSGAIDENSKKYQAKFISGINQQIIGKSIDALAVKVVSGSSLTSGGFNDAIAKIQVQAQA